MTDTNSVSDGKKYCLKCGIQYTHEQRTLEEAALVHWIEEHPESENLRELLTGLWVRVECTGCEQEFFSPVAYGAGRIAADAYCPDCIEEDKFRRLYAQDLSPKELLEKEADPTTDELENRYAK